MKPQQVILARILTLDISALEIFLAIFLIEFKSKLIGHCVCLQVIGIKWQDYLSSGHNLNLKIHMSKKWTIYLRISYKCPLYQPQSNEHSNSCSRLGLLSSSLQSWSNEVLQVWFLIKILNIKWRRLSTYSMSPTYKWVIF